MKSKTSAVLVLCVGSALAGCTTSLKVTTVSATSLSGQVYFLPRVEHLVTLERELTQCKVEPQLDGLVRSWFRPEWGNLYALVANLQVSAQAGEHPGCAAAKPNLEARFGDAFSLIENRTKSGKPKDCKKVDVGALTKEYEKTAYDLTQAFFADPVFLRGADWGSSCPEDKLNPLAVPRTDLTGLLAHLREFAPCAPEDKTKDPARVSLTILMRATASPSALPDVSKAYSIDYQEMSGQVKKTEYKVTKYPNGTLKSVNSVIEDKTAEVISSTLRGVLQLAATSSGFPVTFAAAPATDPAMAIAGGITPPLPLRNPVTFAEWLAAQPPHPALLPLCNQTTLQTLRLRAGLAAQVESAAEQIGALDAAAKKAAALAETKTAEAAKLQVLHDPLPAGDALKAELATKIKILKEEAAAAVAAATYANLRKADLEKAQNETNAKLTAVRKQLTVTNTLLFRAEEGTEVQVPGEADAVSSWFEPTALAKYCTLPDFPCDSKVPKRLKASVARYLAPETPKFSKCPPEEAGLIYREPVQGILMVCQETACLDQYGKVSALPKNTILAALADFPQLGVLATLPLSNKAFQNNSLIATFSATGSLESLEYKSNARAAAAAKAFEGAAGDILTFAEAKKGAMKNDLETKKAEVEAETALLEAEKKRAEAKKALEAVLNPPPPAQ